MNKLISAMLVFAFASPVVNSSIGVANDGDPQTPINVADIGSSVKLIGRLGYPLGTMVTVQGSWGYPNQSAGPTKDYSLRFTVTRINDAVAEQPIVFPVHSVVVKNRDGSNMIRRSKSHRELDGETWTLRVYETGRFTVVPDEYWQFHGHPAMIQEPAFTSMILGFQHPD